MQSLHRSWQRGWQNLCAAGGGGPLRDRLIECYREPQRKYHTLQHLGECMSHFEAVLTLAERAGEVEIALWFHDAIYNVTSSKNELQSALWAQKELVAAGVSGESCKRVAELTLMTRHATLPVTSDEQLLLDIDLSILGSAPERYAEYESQVREEFGWVPDFVFRRNRKALLKEFLSRSWVYHTAYFRERLEARARENLQRSIATLGR